MNFLFQILQLSVQLLYLLLRLCKLVLELFVLAPHVGYCCHSGGSYVILQYLFQFLNSYPSTAYLA